MRCLKPRVARATVGTLLLIATRQPPFGRLHSEPLDPSYLDSLDDPVASHARERHVGE
jgi:hypothetical protein